MAREKELFRDNLQRLDAAFPNQELLNITDVRTYLGVNYRSAVKMFTFNEHRKISKVKLASELS